MSSPVYALFRAMLTETSARNEGSVFIDNDIRKRLLTGVFDAYYAEAAPGSQPDGASRRQGGSGLLRSGAADPAFANERQYDGDHYFGSRVQISVSNAFIRPFLLTAAIFRIRIVLRADWTLPVAVAPFIV
jgi:hypothetical protein